MVFFTVICFGGLDCHSVSWTFQRQVTYTSITSYSPEEFYPLGVLKTLDPLDLCSFSFLWIYPLIWCLVGDGKMCHGWGEWRTLDKGMWVLGAEPSWALLPNWKTQLWRHLRTCPWPWTTKQRITLTLQLELRCPWSRCLTFWATFLLQESLDLNWTSPFIVLGAKGPQRSYILFLSLLSYSKYWIRPNLKMSEPCEYIEGNSDTQSDFFCSCFAGWVDWGLRDQPGPHSEPFPFIEVRFFPETVIGHEAQVRAGAHLGCGSVFNRGLGGASEWGESCLLWGGGMGIY